MMVQRWFTRAGREEYREARREEKKTYCDILGFLGNMTYTPVT
jgi:hypothetical protein